MLDVDESDLLVHEDGGDSALLFGIQYHGQELVDDRHVHITAVVARDERLCK